MNLQIFIAAILLVLPVSQAYSQVFEKLTDYGIVSVQEPARQEKLFDPFAEEREDLLKDSGKALPTQNEDLGLSEEPDLGDDTDTENVKQSSVKADKKLDSESASASEQHQTVSQHKLTIDQYLRPIWTLSSKGQTNLLPERGGFNFPLAVPPNILQDKPRYTWSDSSIQWQKPIGHHRQLYFEDIALERCGTQVGKWKQNVVSGVNFLGNAVVLPIRRLRQPRWQLYQQQVDRFSDLELTGR